MNKMRLRLGRWAAALAVTALAPGSAFLAAGPASAARLRDYQDFGDFVFGRVSCEHAVREAVETFRR